MDQERATISASLDGAAPASLVGDESSNTAEGTFPNHERPTIEEQTSKEPDARIVELAVGEGEPVLASSVPYYARNILSLAQTGKEELQSELNEEMTIAKGK